MQNGTTDYMGQSAELFTVTEIAEKLKVKKSFFYAPARRKGCNPIPCVKVGKYLRYRLPEVMAWIEIENGGK